MVFPATLPVPLANRFVVFRTYKDKFKILDHYFQENLSQNIKVSHLESSYFVRGLLSKINPIILKRNKKLHAYYKMMFSYAGMYMY